LGSALNMFDKFVVFHSAEIPGNDCIERNTASA
jgi:hypothetical protein